ncbi:hypothetical protein ATHL_00328 [Anaerolinea thermolimosa]|uniref:hypothetical protein n=1 Tax=Anaerolinea thermolimosa TaxID=229919 RepID=UPI000784CD5C|nr:hypothetical protein [Anaerolinea thermolimosa]GAP05495.1 hypothetical protein ATHL_00328 [Anaerolinea thermolimosa]
MIRHDPYTYLLDELRIRNDAEDEETFADALHRLQPYVTRLRESYDASPSRVDFSCEHTRAAYMLVYYPHYIEPLYQILCALPQDVIQTCFNGEKVRAAFLGAGPVPEALGWVAFLNEYAPQARVALANLLDWHVHAWRIGQEITAYALAPYYWPRGKTLLQPFEFDLLNPAALEQPRLQQAIRRSSLIVMQNCLNDLLHAREAVLETFQRILDLAESPTLVVVCDLYFPGVCDLMAEMLAAMTQCHWGEVVFPLQYREVTSCIPPEVITRHLLTGDRTRRLIPRKHTRFYALAVWHV